MKRLFKHIGILLAFTALTAAVTGCNTAEGFGEDVEQLGEQIQEDT